MLLLNKSLLNMAKGLWKWIILIACMKLVVLIGGTQFASIIATYLGNLFDLSMSIQETIHAIGYAFLYALLMLIGDLAIGELEYLCNGQARTNIRNQIFKKILELDVGNIESIGPTSAITSSVDAIENMLPYYSKYLPGLIYSFLAPFYLFFRLKEISFRISLFLLIVTILIFPLNNTFRVQIDHLKKKYWSNLEDLTGYYLESVRGLVTLKLLNQDENRKEILSQKAKIFCDSIMEMMKVNFTSFLFSDGMIYLACFIATFLCGMSLLHHEIAIGDALMILMMSFTFFTSVRSLMTATHNALTGVAAVNKIETVLSIDTSKKIVSKERINTFEGFQVNHIHFSYDEKRNILDDVSLKIPKGGMVALAGKSGCGKSTIANILMHFNEIQSGTITLNGRNLYSYLNDELHSYITMVPQNVGIFSGTIRSNLLLANENATEEMIWNVLEKVKLKDQVEELGLDSEVGDSGSKLSGGQKQKIGIARALLTECEYIIFDEATSSVDVESENEIWSCLQELALSKTLIIISHRLSTIQNASTIYVLDHGRIVEEGSHEELMKKEGIYASLVKEQDLLEKQGIERRNQYAA